MAAMAATCPSENLRPLIYSLVEELLDKCSSEGRLFYILDTLDHCPYDNLKVAVIGTLKKQISKDGPVCQVEMWAERRIHCSHHLRFSRILALGYSDYQTTFLRMRSWLGTRSHSSLKHSVSTDF